jgi:hypothetical protein
VSLHDVTSNLAFKNETRVRVTVSDKNTLAYCGLINYSRAKFYDTYYKLKDLGLYSKHFIFFVTYRYTQ